MFIEILQICLKQKEVIEALLSLVSSSFHTLYKLFHSGMDVHIGQHLPISPLMCGKQQSPVLHCYAFNTELHDAILMPQTHCVKGSLVSMAVR